MIEPRPTARFPAAARLLRPSEYAACLKNRRVSRGALFVLHSAPAATSDAPACPRARLGLIVAKRLAPLSVSRNALKRVAREAFRQIQGQLPPADYVVRLGNRIPDTSLTELKRQARAELDRHFRRAAQC